MPPPTRSTSSSRPLISALKSTSKRKSPVEKDAAVSETGAISTPLRLDKAQRPEGTSPMKIAEPTQNGDNSTTKSDPKDSESGSKSDSLAEAIASARKTLFRASLPVDNDADEAISVATSKSRKWKPIKRPEKIATSTSDNTPIVDLTGTDSRRGTSFAADTNFKEKEKAASTTTTGPGKATETDELREVVVQLRIKILPGAEDVQETVLGLMHHCLTVLKERDETACFVNSKKSLTAHKLTDFPRDFTDFHDDWGIWDEPMKSFLNTIPAGRGRSFTGSFYFRSTWEPEKLFEKTLLKMAAVVKLKGSIVIAVKACQCLDTERAIIFFNVPFCSAASLRNVLRKAMVEQKSRLINRYPAKWPKMEWGRPLPDFELIRDFVRNTPWRNREEKSTIQAYHKLAWHLECPSNEADRVYKLLKAMKSNKSLYRILGDAATILRAPGPNASEDMRKKLATAVSFHTAFQMSINHVPLRGLLDPDKEAELIRVEDEDGDSQEAVRLTVRQVMFSHKVNHLPLWQAIVQNDDGSWRGYYSNGVGCQNHKSVATAWAGAIGAHLKFHLLKRGVTETTALKLARASCSTQTFHDACTSTFRDGKVISAAQAEMDDELEEMQQRARWVDITVGMEALERKEYDTERIIQRLEPSDPRALNFDDEQSLKTLTSQAAGTAYTIAPVESLGETAYEPPIDEVDSQESDLFELDNDDGFVEDPFHDEDRDIIANMEEVVRDTSRTGKAAAGKDVDMDQKEDDSDKDRAIPSISSPGKINRITTHLSNIPSALSEEQREMIHNMLKEWTETRGGEDLPPSLQLLAGRIGLAAYAHTPTRGRRGQRDKVSSPNKTELPGNKLAGKRFVLTGKWPRPDGLSLLSEKETVKDLIERHGGRVTAGFSNSTDFLVVGDTPGQKSVIEANDRGIQIVTLDQVESVITNDDMAVADLAGPYPDVANAILFEKGTQVQRLPPPQDLNKGAEDAPTATVAAGPTDGFGGGHRDG